MSEDFKQPSAFKDVPTVSGTPDCPDPTTPPAEKGTEELKLINQKGLMWRIYCFFESDITEPSDCVDCCETWRDSGMCVWHEKVESFKKELKEATQGRAGKSQEEKPI